MAHPAPIPMPANLADAKREILALRDQLASYEANKRHRQKAEAEAASTPAAQLEVPVLNAVAWLEGVSDGSEDVSRPVDVRDKCEEIIRLIRTLHSSLKAAQ